MYLCLKGGNSTAATYNVNFFVEILIIHFELITVEAELHILRLI